MPADMSEKKGDEYKYLPLECPNCGFKGKVKISRLDQTFHCKQCGKVFHVTLDGTVTGDRPLAELVRDDAARVVVDQPSRLEVWFGKMPPAAKWGVLGVMALVLAYFASFLLEPEEPLPGDFEERAVLAGKAIGHGDWKLLKRLAKKGTTSELGKWYEQQRPKDWDDVTADTTVDVQIKQVFKNLKKYEGTHPVIDQNVVIRIAVVDKPDPLDLQLTFSEDKYSEWWLDGEAMVKAAQAPQKGKAKNDGEAESKDAG
jgi:hypothetical protein